MCATGPPPAQITIPRRAHTHTSQSHTCGATRAPPRPAIAMHASTRARGSTTLTVHPPSTTTRLFRNLTLTRRALMFCVPAPAARAAVTDGAVPNAHGAPHNHATLSFEDRPAPSASIHHNPLLARIQWHTPNKASRAQGSTPRSKPPCRRIRPRDSHAHHISSRRRPPPTSLPVPHPLHLAAEPRSGLKAAAAVATA